MSIRGFWNTGGCVCVDEILGALYRRVHLFFSGRIFICRHYAHSLPTAVVIDMR